MGTANNSNTKKIIAWFGVIAAVVIVYMVVASAQKPDTAAMTPNQASSTSQPKITGNTMMSNGSTPSDMPMSPIVYKDGTYSASANYRTPDGREGVTVTLTLAGGVVTNSELATTGYDGTAKRYQSQFASGYKSQVVGKKIADIRLSRVSGSSLTSNGFNAAVDKIEAEAQAASQP